MSRPLTIVGGGLAGLSLGIGLRRRGVAVTVWEAGRYPRHRVCGEFISGSGIAARALPGLLEVLPRHAVRAATTAAFFEGGPVGGVRPLPEPALCISRFVLDECLAREFVRLGGELRSGERWSGGWGAGIVRASGRRVEPKADGWRLFGLKVHAQGMELAADVEMHFLSSGYVGLCRLPDGEVNVCGLFRSGKTVPDLAQRWREWLGGKVGSVLHARLASARFDENSLCSVAGLSLRPGLALQRTECCVGDALTMIPPVTGNGMSMAFESAELAVEPLTEFHRGKLEWEEALRRIAVACDDRFAVRLRWAGWLQRGLLRPAVRSGLLFFGTRSPWVWRQLFRLTR